jgi:NADH:ubiquinone oxidoreductase subunit B-like Fe-S oxidoreductase
MPRRLRPNGSSRPADGGVFAGSYAIAGGASSVVPVDLVIPGCPPSPAALLKGLLALMEGPRESNRTTA